MPGDSANVYVTFHSRHGNNSMKATCRSQCRSGHKKVGPSGRCIVAVKGATVGDHTFAWPAVKPCVAERAYLRSRFVIVKTISRFFVGTKAVVQRLEADAKRLCRLAFVPAAVPQRR